MQMSEIMLKNLKLIPRGVNAKLLMRHSIRPVTEGEIEVSFDVELTKEGKELASDLGTFLKEHSVNIKTAKSSASPRCIQTAEMILSGYGKNIPVEIENILHDMWIENRSQWEVLYERHHKNTEELLNLMLKNEYLEGVYPVHITIEKLFQILKLNENTPCSDHHSYNLDLFITHDVLIMLLLAFLLHCGLKGTQPNMLEGCILWVENNLLCIVWRGEVYRVPFY